MIRTERLGLIAGPLGFLAVSLGYDPVPERPETGFMLAVLLWMAIWWLSEAVPLAATSLLPVVLMPAFGILEPLAVASAYMNPIVFLFIGGMLIAQAMERLFATPMIRPCLPASTPAPFPRGSPALARAGAAARQDHYGSSGTRGLGLPGVRRLMDAFTLESEPGKGTRVTAIKWL